ncbi:MAG: hypothetical protein IKD70_03460 [Eggerthellaceae bacterium]|nr:hypothetical protein [Eggerthellaceae bacterium]
MKRLDRRTRIALIVLLAAMVFVAVGIALGQPLQVWQKAALICYECIGLG